MTGGVCEPGVDTGESIASACQLLGGPEGQSELLERPVCTRMQGKNMGWCEQLLDWSTSQLLEGSALYSHLHTYVCFFPVRGFHPIQL